MRRVIKQPRLFSDLRTHNLKYSYASKPHVSAENTRIVSNWCWSNSWYFGQGICTYVRVAGESTRNDNCYNLMLLLAEMSM